MPKESSHILNYLLIDTLVVTKDKEKRILSVELFHILAAHTHFKFIYLCNWFAFYYSLLI